MDTTLRVMIINYGNTRQECKVSFDGGGKLEYFQCTKPPTGSADPKASQGSYESPFPMQLEPGEIYGFKSATPATVVKPATSSVHVITAAGKDPWPPPPMAPSGFANVWDFQARYFNFLSGGGVSGPDPVVEMSFKVVAPPGPVQAQHKGDHTGSKAGR